MTIQITRPLVPAKMELLYFHGVSPPPASFPNYRFTDVQLDYGFKKTTISYPQLATNGLIPYDVYTHYTTENSYMTFGKLQKKEQYDAANTLLHKTEYIYKKSMAFGNFMLTNNVDVRVSNVNNWMVMSIFTGHFMAPLSALLLPSI